MRPLCEPCEIPMREEGSFPAYEGEGEVQVLAWVCPRCGGRSEETAPPPDLAPAPRNTARRVA